MIGLGVIVQCNGMRDLGVGLYTIVCLWHNWMVL